MSLVPRVVDTVSGACHPPKIYEEDLMKVSVPSYSLQTATALPLASVPICEAVAVCGSGIVVEMFIGIEGQVAVEKFVARHETVKINFKHVFCTLFIKKIPL